MEIDLLTLAEQDGFRAVRRSTSRGGQYNGPCPFPDCGGTDRFRVQPNQGTYGWFACTQCGRRGSAVDYLILRRGLPKREALALVGWRPKDGRASCLALPAYVQDVRPRWQEPPEQWQEAATEFYQTCQHVLWSRRGAHALGYLRGRGLSDKIIQGAHLGYHPAEAYGLAQVWGKATRLPRGIVIPWFFVGSLWRITIRDETVVQGASRYTQLAGGSNGLYLADSPRRLQQPVVVLVEGEFDALSVLQECRDLVAVVATGTTQGSHTPRWVSLLAQQERVLVAFDAENSGDRAARWWLTRLDNACRLRPWWKDANQMLQDGADLHTWIAGAVDLDCRIKFHEIAQQGHHPTAPAPPERPDSPEEDTGTAFARLQGVKRVSTPLGLGVIFPYTPLAVQVQRGRIGVLLEHPVHASGQRLEYFFPYEVQSAEVSQLPIVGEDVLR